MTRFLLIVAVGQAVCIAFLLPNPRKVSCPAWLLRRNYRGKMLPLTGGYCYFTCAWISLAVGYLRGYIEQPLPWAVLIAGFAIGGGIDDFWGGKAGGGFLGHVRNLVKGKPTTGCLKAILGGLTAIAACWLLVNAQGLTLIQTAVRVIVGAMLVALSANLVNLLDLRPGRAAKVSFLPFIALAIFARDLWTPVMLGAIVVVGYADLRERTLMGDLGSNLLGALIGLSLVATLSLPWQCAALFIVMAGNVLSEVYSFTKLIERNRILRAIDRIGRV